jgi:hypothetical protein
MDRIGTGTIIADPMAVAIYGNIQPKVFRQNIAALSVDGMIQRFIPAILSGEYDNVPNHVPSMMTNAPQWEQMVRQLFSLQPMQYRLSADAYQVFRTFQHWYARAKEDERLLRADDTYMTAFGKLEGTTGRIILVHHLMHSPYAQEVSADTVTKCVEITKTYIIPALRYTYADIGGVVDKGLDQWLIEYMVRVAGEQDTITMRDVKRAARARLAGMTLQEQDATVRDSMDMLEREGWVVMIEDNRKTTMWAINPTVKTSDQAYRKRVIQAKQRQMDESRAIVLAAGKYMDRRFVRGYTPDMDETE